jgi:hypothetical protein
VPNIIPNNSQIEGYKEYYNAYPECPAEHKDYFGKTLRCKYSLHGTDVSIPCVNDSDFEFCKIYRGTIIEIQRILNKEQ